VAQLLGNAPIFTVPALLPTRDRQVTLGCADRRQDLVRVLRQGVPGRGQPDRRADPHGERGADIAFQGPHLIADGGLGEAEFAGRRRIGLGTRNGLQQAESLRRQHRAIIKNFLGSPRRASLECGGPNQYLQGHVLPGRYRLPSAAADREGAQAVRRAPGAGRCEPGRRGRRGGRRHRRVRLGQVHAVPVHQPAGDSQFRHHHDRRCAAGRRGTGAGAITCRCRHGVPVLQPLRPPQRPGQRDAGAHEGPGPASQAGRGRGPSAAGPGRCRPEG